jgi:3-oxoacyl-[acyl-carrier-protein] synthase-3
VAHYSRILGTGKAVPARVVTNDDLAKVVDTSDAWIRERTGIQERRFLEEGRVTSDLCAEAALGACRAAALDPAALDCIIVCTVTPDMPMPATAVTVQQKIGACCAAFDMAAACAGFIYGMAAADAFIRAGSMKNVLVIGVEVLSRAIDMSDRNTCILFGDGAGAVVLGAVDAPAPPPGQHDPTLRAVLSTHLYADGAHADLLNIPCGGTAMPATPEALARREQYIRMQGKKVFTHAVKNISRASMTALEHNHCAAEDVDVVVAHQANLRILEAVSERVQIPLERFFLNIHKYGNTSAASIPIALDEAIQAGRVKQGDLVLMAALGAGFSWGSALVRM